MTPADVKALEALRDYIRHKPTCPRFIQVRFAPEPGWVSSSYVKPCNCGLEAVLDALLQGAGRQTKTPQARALLGQWLEEDATASDVPVPDPPRMSLRQGAAHLDGETQK
jgi:hypothetical protein